jgi:hypothetical protein
MFSFGLWVDMLSKAVGHKYIKRIPYQSKGKRRYRYIYKVTHSHQGKHAFDESHLKVGTAFSLNTKAGAEFHGHVVKVEGDQVSYKIDDGPEKGTIKTVSKQELLAKLNDVHGIESKLSSERDKLRNQIKEAKKNKASEKQIARLEARLSRLGGKQESEVLSGEMLDLFNKHQVSPDMVALDKWYQEKPRHAEPWGSPLNNTKATYQGQPDSAMYQRLKNLAPRTKEACERYNRGLKRALAEIAPVYAQVKQEAGELERRLAGVRVTAEEINEQNALVKELHNTLAELLTPISAPAGLSWDFVYMSDLEREAPEVAEKVRQILKGVDKYVLSTRSIYEAYQYSFDDGSLVFRGKRIDYIPRLDGQDAEERKLQQESKRARRSQVSELLGELLFDPEARNEADIDIREFGVLKARGGPAPQIVGHFVDKMKNVYPEYRNGLRTINIDYKRKGFRANCSTLPDRHRAVLRLASNDSKKTMLHEVAHTLEYFAQDVVDAVTLSHATRVQPQRVVKYSKDGNVFDDEYVSNYTGKLYNKEKPLVASEFVTMGVQEFVDADSALNLLTADPHHFAVAYGIMKGYFSDEN